MNTHFVVVGDGNWSWSTRYHRGRNMCPSSWVCTWRKWTGRVFWSLRQCRSLKSRHRGNDERSLTSTSGDTIPQGRSPSGSRVYHRFPRGSHSPHTYCIINPINRITMSDYNSIVRLTCLASPLRIDSSIWEKLEVTIPSAGFLHRVRTLTRSPISRSPTGTMETPKGTMDTLLSETRRGWPGLVGGVQWCRLRDGILDGEWWSEEGSGGDEYFILSSTSRLCGGAGCGGGIVIPPELVGDLGGGDGCIGVGQKGEIEFVIYIPLNVDMRHGLVVSKPILLYRTIQPPLIVLWFTNHNTRIRMPAPIHLTKHILLVVHCNTKSW